MNTVKITEKQQAVWGIITETSQVILFLLILNLLNTSITGNTYNVGDSDDGYDADKVGKNETEDVIPVKHLSNFWRTLSIPLIGCEIELILNWSKNCVFADMTVVIVSTSWIRISNNRHKTIRSSCYVVKTKWHETSRTIKIWI